MTITRPARVKKLRRCLGCGKMFMSEGPGFRKCYACGPNRNPILYRLREPHKAILPKSLLAEINIGREGLEQSSDVDMSLLKEF